jgi:nicotinate-nucleotide pyrophosphorylase (carboxylating)
MTSDQLREAVAIVAGRAITEASGRVTPITAAAIAASGVDLISVGWLTHSAPVLDIGLDFVETATATETIPKRIAQVL